MSVRRRTVRRGLVAIAAAAAVMGPLALLAAPASAADVAAPQALLARQSVSTLGAQADDTSSANAVSADGRYVLFQSDASNLGFAHPGTAWPNSVIYVRDNVTGTTTRVPVSDADGPNGDTGGYEYFGLPVPYGTKMSADGNLLAWTNPVLYQPAEEDLRQPVRVVVFDRSSSTQRIVSPQPDPSTGYPTSAVQALSADGSKLVWSKEERLPDGIDSWGNDAWTYPQTLWVYDVATQESTQLLQGSTQSARLSSNGTWLAYSAPTGSGTVMTVVNLTTGQHTTVRAEDGTLPDEGDVSGLSDDGNVLAFTSSASNWVPIDGNGNSDVFLWHRDTGEVTLETVTPAGVQGNGYRAWLSPDGTKLAFFSDYSHFVPGDSGSTVDLFIKDLTTGTFTSPTVFTGRGASDYDYRDNFDFSEDSRHFVFDYSGDSLDPLDANGTTDVFLGTLPGASSPALQADAAGSQLTWRNGPQASRVVIRSAENGYPLQATAGDAVYAGTGTSAATTTLTAGHTYGVAAFSYNSAGTLLSRKIVTVRPTARAVTLAVRVPALITYGTKASVSVILSTSSGPVPGRPVTLWRRAAGTTTWTKLTAGTTSSTGVFRTTVQPTRTWQLQARHADEGGYAVATSSTVTVTVAQKVAVSVTPTTAAAGRAATFTARLTPAASLKVTLQRKKSTGWVTVTSARTSSSGTCKFTTVPPKGTSTYRVVAPAAAGLASGQASVAVRRG